MRERQLGNVTILTPKGYLTGGDERTSWIRRFQSLSEAGNKKPDSSISPKPSTSTRRRSGCSSRRTQLRAPRGPGQAVLVDKRIENIFVITKLSLCSTCTRAKSRRLPASRSANRSDRERAGGTRDWPSSASSPDRGGALSEGELLWRHRDRRAPEGDHGRGGGRQHPAAPQHGRVSGAQLDRDRGADAGYANYKARGGEIKLCGLGSGSGICSP